MPIKGYKYTSNELAERSIIRKNWLETTESGKSYQKFIEDSNNTTIKNYNENSKLCKLCNNALSYEKRQNIFCNHTCSAKYYNVGRPPMSEETKEKLSISLKNSQMAKEKTLQRKNRTQRFKLICKFCQKEFDVTPSEKSRVYCSHACYLSDENKKGGQGGCRKGSGRGKHGWYKNYWCDSSYELSFVIYNLDHNIRFERNKIGFDYVYNNENYKFYPDFIVDGKYIEIKGYFNDKQLEKIKQFPHNLDVIDKVKIKPYLTYAIEKYGQNFIELYEGNPHNEKHNTCGICNLPCKNKFCSRSCGGKNRLRERKKKKLLDN